LLVTAAYPQLRWHFNDLGVIAYPQTVEHYGPSVFQSGQYYFSGLPYYFEEGGSTNQDFES
jgi:hypothetical protein